MNENVKTIPFLDLSDTPKVTSYSYPVQLLSDNPSLLVGRSVSVQTERTRDLNFYVVLEVVDKCNGKWIGIVDDADGYEGALDTIYPGDCLSFEFDNMARGDRVWFEEDNVACVIK